MPLSKLEIEKSMPLSYASTKSVIQYLDPNLRFRLSQQCPSHCSIEKSAPLHLDSLKLSDNSISVDGIEYELAIYRQRGARPKKLKVDVTEKGTIDMNIVVEEDPNEILIDLRGNQERTIAEVLTELANQRRDENNEKMIQSKMKYFLVLKVGRSSEVMIYERKLHDAVKYLVERFLGGRGILKVGTLSIGSRGILRIPSSLNFKIRHLELRSEDNNKIFETIKQLLTISPLSSISLSHSYNLRDEDPVVESTGILIFQSIDFFDNDMLNNLNKLRHKRVHLSFDRFFELQNVVWLIDNWIEFGRNVGTHYSLDVVVENKGWEILKIVKRNHKERIDEKSDGENVIIHMNNTSDLHIEYELEDFQTLMHLRVELRS